jgi:hypothetical protein
MLGRVLAPLCRRFGFCQNLDAAGVDRRRVIDALMRIVASGAVALFALARPGDAPSQEGQPAALRHEGVKAHIGVDAE